MGKTNVEKCNRSPIFLSGITQRKGSEGHQSRTRNQPNKIVGNPTQSPKGKEGNRNRKEAPTTREKTVEQKMKVSAVPFGVLNFFIAHVSQRFNH